MGRFLCMVVVVIVALSRAAHSADMSEFADWSLRGANGALQLPGRLFVPPEATSEPRSRRPLIVFLHGSGEAGTDNANQVNGNIDSLLAEAKRRGAYLYAPQTTTDEWDGKTLTDNLMVMIDRAVVDENVDPGRLYVTGLSSGGGGVWNMLSRYPRRFAAALSISADTPAPDFVAGRLLGIPICAFHSRDDDTVPVGEDRNTVARVFAAAGVATPQYPSTNSNQYFLISDPNLASHRTYNDRVRQQHETMSFAITSTPVDLIYNELPNGGHGIWPAVYNSPAVYDWLFSHAVPNPCQATVAGDVACVSRREFRMWHPRVCGIRVR